MTEIKRPVNHHQRYHAHVYFDAGSLESATSLIQQVAAQFGLKIGRIHQKLVGPHSMWSCQISFGAADFEALIPWLDQHRAGLSVLVHPLTGDDLRDHTVLASWLGDRVELDLSGFTE